jgi:hypothetical protein
VLLSLGCFPVDADGGTVELTGTRRIGRGCVPVDYWQAPNGRVVVITGMHKGACLDA